MQERTIIEENESFEHFGGKPMENSASASTVSPSPSHVTKAVHPLAAKINSLQSPMTMEVQEKVSKYNFYIIFGALFFSFPLALIASNILISFYTIIFSGLVCMVLFVPNWYGNHDKTHWYSMEKTYYFYEEYRKAIELQKGSKLPFKEFPEKRENIEEEKKD